MRRLSSTFLKHKHLRKDKQPTVIIILDNLRGHHAKMDKELLAGKEERIEIFYLPPYSPELNPDEYLNGDLKAGVHCGRPARTQSKLKKKAISRMRILQKKQDCVAKYFEYEKIH